MNSHDLLEIALKKEALLGELVAWLRAKGLYEEAMRDCPSGIKAEKEGGETEKRRNIQ